MAAAPVDRAVLVTGYPGLQARKLVEHILSVEPTTEVYVQVLESRVPVAERALAALPDETRARVTVLLGDVAAIDMGLSGAEYREVASRVERIHHVAHVSYVGVDAETAEWVNVQGAREAVELARATHDLRCLIHHSTAFVSGTRTGIIRESELDEGQRFDGVVQKTRMSAERVMRAAMNDIPVTVVRPTMLVGDSGTGEADRFDGPYLLVLLMLALPEDAPLPLPAGGDSWLNLVPVDFVVKAAHHIGRLDGAPGTTVHLASSEDLTAQRVFDAIARAGGRRTVRSVVVQLGNAILRRSGMARLIKEPSAFLKRVATSAHYDTTHLNRLLAGSGIACPPFESYVETLVAAVQDRIDERGWSGEVLDDPLTTTSKPPPPAG